MSLRPGRKECPKFPGTECQCEFKRPQLGSGTEKISNDQEKDIQRDREINKQYLTAIAPFTGARLMRERGPNDRVLARTPGSDTPGFIPLKYAHAM